MTTQPEALRLADILQHKLPSVKCLEVAAAELRRLHEELENERMRSAACGVIANANTRESAAEQRKMLPEYWSGSAQDVAQAVDREMDCRDRIAALEAALTQAAGALESFIEISDFTPARAVHALATARQTLKEKNT